MKCTLERIWLFQNPKGFLLDLLEYAKVYQPSLEGDEPCDPERNERVTMALNALSNVINSNPGMFIVFMIPVKINLYG